MNLYMVGPHTYLSGQLDEASKAWCQSSPVLKAFDDTAPLHWADPRAITIYRDYDEQNLFETILNKLGALRPTYVEGLNEPDVSLSALPDLINWHKLYVKRCHEVGLKVAGYSIAVGNLDSDGVAMLAAENWGDVDAVAYHAYWGVYGPFSDWTTYRYRRWYEQTGGVMPPCLITEAGRENIIQEGGDGLPGWLTQGVSAEQYYAEWQQFDAELREDAKKKVIWQGREWPLVLGATGFALGANERWQKYELAPLAAWFARDSVIANAPTEGEDVAEDPRIQQLLDQNAIITQALIDFRHGRFEGADGMDGRIVQLNGGILPDGWAPTYPKA